MIATKQLFTAVTQGDIATITQMMMAGYDVNLSNAVRANVNALGT